MERACYFLLPLSALLLGIAGLVFQQSFSGRFPLAMTAMPVLAALLFLLSLRKPAGQAGISSQATPAKRRFISEAKLLALAVVCWLLLDLLWLCFGFSASGHRLYLLLFRADFVTALPFLAAFSLLAGNGGLSRPFRLLLLFLLAMAHFCCLFYQQAYFISLALFLAMLICLALQAGLLFTLLFAVCFLAPLLVISMLDLGLNMLWNSARLLYYSIASIPSGIHDLIQVLAASPLLGKGFPSQAEEALYPLLRGAIRDKYIFYVSVRYGSITALACVSGLVIFLSASLRAVLASSGRFKAVALGVWLMVFISSALATLGVPNLGFGLPFLEANLAGVVLLLMAWLKIPLLRK